jgi:phosphoenolpyruvate-protein phosphotransferase
MPASFRGLAAAPGVGIGVTVPYRSGHFALAPEADAAGGVDGIVAPDEREGEWQRFLRAQRQVDDELKRLDQGDSTIVSELFAAHRLILQDQTLVDAVRSAVLESGLTAAGATVQAVGDLAQIMHGLEDDYFAGRASDLLDIGQRLLVALDAALRPSRLDGLPPESVLVCDDITPSEVATLHPGQVAGIAIAAGAPNAHASILARSLGIPMACGLGAGLLRVQGGRPCIVDGTRGLFVVEPDAVNLRRYAADRQSLIEERAVAARHAHEPSVTLDGARVPVLANANSGEDVLAVADAGAEGVGLLRTEFLFQSRLLPPSLDEQADTFARYLHHLGPRLLTVRALDAGGDKPLEFFPHPREQNPFLGLRGIRLLLSRPDILRTQYQALQVAALEAGAVGRVRFMLPMISTVEEVRRARDLLSELNEHGPSLPIGIMVEVPSAALIAAQLAPHADFFSIGTNDLAQYTLASDRTDPNVGAMADPLHPSVLRLIAMTCEAAQLAGLPVSLCGEVAGHVPAVKLLLGLGVQELSAPLPAVALVKAAVRRNRLADCRLLAARALGAPDAAAVRELLHVRQVVK